MATKLKAPKGKTRVVCIEPHSHDDCLVDDYDDQDVAFNMMDKHNLNRNSPTDNVYFAYNDKGRCVRDDENVSGPGVSAS